VKLAFVADPLERLHPSLDSTVGLMKAALDRGHEVWITEASCLAVIDGHPHARSRSVRMMGSNGTASIIAARERRWVPLDEMDAVFMRTDPPLDGAYLAATYVLDLVNSASTKLVNDPRGIRNANEKLFALRFPELIPPTLVTADPELITGFVSEHPLAVVKPIDGLAGIGVVQLRAWDLNVASIVELATDGGRIPVVVQAYVPEVAAGNKRLFVVGGEIIGAVLRFPQATDFRIGPPAKVVPATAADVAMIERLAPALRRHGLWLVGIDVIGERLIEVNVTSPGAWTKTDVALGTTIARDIVVRLEAECMTLKVHPVGTIRQS
jgi:glutathione synthase